MTLSQLLFGRMSVLIFSSVILCCLGIGSSQSSSGTDGASLTQIFPKSQRVAEGSRVLLTCITSLDQASFTWTKPVRVVDATRDGVVITQVSHNVSTLEIPRAHVKRHKRTYRCTASTSLQTSNDATLKVMPRTRLHKNFPRITAVRQEAKYQYASMDQSDIQHVSTELQCMTDETEGNKRPTKWRWILGSNLELRYTSAFEAGRLEKTTEGHLLIHNPQPSDYETTYICVAENKWGTAYSQPIMMNKTSVPGVEESKTCQDRNGRAVQHGQIYQPDTNDPCIQCECFHGSPGRCMTVSCEAPTCEFYEMSKDKCCDYTCIGGGVKEKKGECRAYNGTMVPLGEIYNPEADACVTCVCSETGPVHCASVSCIPPPMPCATIKPVPGKCCQFMCDDDMSAEPEPIEEKPMTKVLGHVYVQQAGPRSAIVHWKLPDSYDHANDQMKTFSVNMYKDLETMANVRRVKVTERSYVVLDDLDPNTDYYIMVNGTSEKKMSVLMTRTVQFTLRPKASTALVVSDSLGQVYESRGSIQYNGYSLPRQFTPISKQRGLDVVYNLNSFHKVEISSYNEVPCPDQDCGLLRFYEYNTNGELENRMSLMFVDDRDFLWAKTHL